MRPFKLFTALALLLAPVVINAAPISSPRERLSLDTGWRFHKGDDPAAGNQLTYTALRSWELPVANDFTTNPPAMRPAGKPAQELSFTHAEFDDSHWRLLDLPHDWGIEGPFKQEYPGRTGKLPWWGIAWYRKHLDLPASDAGKRIYLDVDGAMSYATVWLNGHFVGGWPYGYASWRVYLTPYLKFGGDNLLAIRLDNPPDSSRWYPGGGIYRNVWLVKTSPVHIAHWGVYVTTPKVNKQSATAEVRVRVDNDTAATAALTVKNEVYELNADGQRGTRIASLKPNALKIAAHKSQSGAGQVVIQNPGLWTPEHPRRYVVVTSLEQGGKCVDQLQTPFGIRSIQFTADHGFLLNGQRVPLKGVCDHSDLGALGMAINTSALKRQIKILQGMGCNAIRTSHNPPAPELLDLCDRMGMLVMDESFDCWRKGKTKNDYHLLFDDWHERDLRAELRRDRNHPSVILWSIGNEVRELGSPEGRKIAAELTAIAHEEDPTRPTTSANNNVHAGYNGFQQHEDVFGYNYKPHEYGRFHVANPKIPLFGSETASCISSRGEYFFPVSNNKADGLGNFQVSSYDLYAPPWATTPDTEFAAQDKYAFVAGEFVWTGFDYLGEPTPYNADRSNLLNFTDSAERAKMQQELATLGKIQVPARSSYFGIVDLAGFPKDRYYLYQSRWRPDFPMAHILPHWNWPNRVGKVTPVMVYTSGDAAELFLNGRSLGRKEKGPYQYRLRWDDVKYEPGVLKVIAYKHGKPWAEDTVRTTGPAAALRLAADCPTIKANGKDLSFITVEVMDARGDVVPTAEQMMHFRVEGAARLIAVDNGDATSHLSFQGGKMPAFNGKCLAVLQSIRGDDGEVVLRVQASGLPAASLEIHADQQP